MNFVIVVAVLVVLVVLVVAVVNIADVDLSLKVLRRQGTKRHGVRVRRRRCRRGELHVPVWCGEVHVVPLTPWCGVGVRGIHVDVDEWRYSVVVVVGHWALLDDVMM